MKDTKYTIFIILLIIFFTACSRREESVKKKVVAKIGDEMLYADELNTIIKQELFDELNKIYDIKKKALEQLINVKVLQSEANKKQLSYQQFINDYTDNQIKRLGLDSLFRHYNIQSTIEFRDTNMYNISINSTDGKYSRLYQLRGAIVDDLLDSLKQNKRIVQYLYPPKSPLIDLADLHTYYRGNLHSKISVIIISDFDCGACINSHDLYESIYQQYKEKVKFGYIHYSAMPTLAQIASEAANRQNRFWEFHDSLYAHKGYIDSTAVYDIAHSLSMDINKFKKDIENVIGQKLIEKTINQLVLIGVYATPTIIVNGRLIVHSNSKDEITHLIDEELSK